jgi:hypothetical protein
MRPCAACNYQTTPDQSFNDGYGNGNSSMGPFYHNCGAGCYAKTARAIGGSSAVGSGRDIIPEAFVYRLTYGGGFSNTQASQWNDNSCTPGRKCVRNYTASGYPQDIGVTFSARAGGNIPNFLQVSCAPIP